MANGIFRKVTLGISKEAGYGTVSGTTSTYVMPNVELAFTENIVKIKNTAMLGSTYGVDNIKNGLRFVDFTMKMKVDEDILPLLLLQKFTNSTSTVSGETTVYRHELSYSNNNVASSGQSFGLFWDDPDRSDMRVAGARFGSINLSMEAGDVIYAEITGRGIYPTYTGVTNTISGVARDFVSRGVEFSMGDYDGSFTETNLLSATFNHEFGLSEQADNFYLGDYDMSNLFTLEDMFSAELKTHMPDLTIKNNWEDNDKLKSKVIMTDTTRFVSTSVASTNPSIQIDYPAQFITAWAREGGASDIVKQNFTMECVDDPAIATAPIKFTIVNSVASY